MKNNYTADTIQKLDFFAAVRKAPGMYIGSRDADGLQHLVKEIVSNSVDEFLNSNCNEIRVNINQDGSITVKDNGRGIPYGKKGDLTALEMCFTQEHAGGKFLNATGESGYNSAGGMHGLGAKCVNALSDKLIVKSYVKKKVETIEFVDGKAKTHTYEDGEGVGLSVQFYPSSKYLEETKFDADRIKTMLEEFSYLNKGLKLIFNDTDVYYSENGLYDYLNYLNGNKEYLIEPIIFSKSEGMFQVEGAVGYNKSYSSITRLYTNSIPQEKGTHLTGFRTAWTLVLNSFARSKRWLKDKEENLTGADLAEGQILILNFKMIDPVFKGQNKEELSSSEGRTYVQKMASEAISDYCATHEKDIKLIIDKALSARRAREAAQKARDAARNATTKKNSTLNLPTKLVDAWGKDRKKCELIISEGDSAAGGLIGARDSETQAIFPIRGKIINTFKNTNDKTFANQEVNNIVKALGLALDPKTHKLIYDINKLRYGKIILCCDADPDGFAIKNLLITCLWSLCPELVTNGHVYAAVPPLFRITTSKNEYIFLKGPAELEEYKKKHSKEKYLVNRNKG